MAMRPRHRGKYAGLFVEPDATRKVDLRAPAWVLYAIERSAERSGRTFNAQLMYIVMVCQERQLPDVEDERTIDDWKVLLAEFQFRLKQDEEWSPCALLFTGHNQHVSKV